MAVVKVEALCAKSKLNEYDRDVEGEYPIELNESVERSNVADAALDVFHTNVPIKVLDDFSFRVFFEGSVVESSEDHDAYALQNQGRVWIE